MNDDIVARLRLYANASIDGEWASVFRSDLNIAADEIERLRQLLGNSEQLRAERDALWRLTDRLFAEHDALRAERDEVRQSYCSLMEAYRGGDGRVTANKLGWGYLFEEDGK